MPAQSSLLISGAASGRASQNQYKKLEMNHMQYITRTLLAALSITGIFTGAAIAEPLADLSGGQTGTLNSWHRTQSIAGR
jgi:hypothetical protein